MIIVGVDPEYSRAGFASYDTQTGRFFYTHVDYKGPLKAYEDIVTATRHQIYGLNSLIKYAGLVEIYSECPPPSGQYSSGLYGLDVALHISFIEKGYSVFRMYPTMLQHIHGKKKYTKTESVELATKLCNMNGFKLDHKMCHDEAEAILYLFRGLAKNGIINKDIQSIAPGLFDEKEKQLY